MARRFFPFRFSHQDSRAALKLVRPNRALGLAAAANDSPPIDQQLADAFNANNAVMAYVLAITATTLPTLTPQPDWYQDFVNQFSDAKTHAMEWQNSITPGLYAIPQGIINYASLFSLNMMTINQAMPILQSDPNNPQAQQAVQSSLQTLLTGLSTQLQTATAFQKEIDDFATALTSDATNMQTAITNAEQTEGYDADQVQQLQDDINSLNDQIATWQTVVTASAIGAGVSFFAGAVIAIFSFGAGLAFGIIGAAAGIATMIAGEIEIQQLSAQIAADQANMKALNQQIASLKVIQSNLTTLIALSQAASQQVALLLQAWVSLEQQITQVITDLNNAQADLTSRQITQLQNDLNAANADWQTLQSFCQTLVGIQYNGAAPPTVSLPTTPSQKAPRAA